MLVLPPICVPPRKSYVSSYLDDNSQLHLNKYEYLDLSMINHKCIISKNENEVFILIFLHDERRYKLIQKFTNKLLKCRIIFHAKCSNNLDSSILLKKLMKFFKLSVVSYKRICATIKNGEYNNILNENFQNAPNNNNNNNNNEIFRINNNNGVLLKNNLGTPPNSPTFSSIISSNLNSESNNSSFSSINNIPYKQSTIKPRADLIRLSDNFSLHKISIESLSSYGCRPLFQRSKSTPNSKELEIYPRIPLAACNLSQ